MEGSDEQDMERMQEGFRHPPKQTMSKKAIIMTVVIFVFIVAGMFIFAYLKKSEQTAVQPPEEQQEEQSDRYRHITRVEGKHFFIDGVHTVVGEILMPTPCDLLNAETIVAESFPEQISIEFTVINNAESCVQVVTPARFKVEAHASENAAWSARLQGRSVELNLIPAGEGETPDDFEVFLKG